MFLLFSWELSVGVGLNTADRLTRRASRRESTMERQNTRRGRGSMCFKRPISLDLLLTNINTWPGKGSIFSTAGQTEKSFESRRTSIVGGRRTLAGEKFKSLIRHHVMVKKCPQIYHICEHTSRYLWYHMLEYLIL